METFLAKDGIDVKTLSPMPERRTATEVKGGGYHMVVLDLMMPNMDGVEVLAAESAKWTTTWRS